MVSFDRFAASLGSIERVIQLAKSGMMPPTPTRDARAERANCASDACLGSTACVPFAMRVRPPTEVEVLMPAEGARLNGHFRLSKLDLLSHQYKGTLALRGIDVTVRPGDLVVVRGPASSGKTALMLTSQLLARPNKGEIRFGFGASTDLVKVNELTHDYDQIRCQIGVVSSLSQQLFRTTIETNLCLGARREPSSHSMMSSTRWEDSPPCLAHLGLMPRTDSHRAPRARPGAHRPVSVQDLKEACVRVGIYETILALKSGFQTMVCSQRLRTMRWLGSVEIPSIASLSQVGDSSGVIFSKSEINQLMLVRALVRKPKLMLLDGADDHMRAAARSCFLSLLADLRGDGVGVLIASKCDEVKRLASTMVELSDEGRMLSAVPLESAEVAEESTEATLAETPPPSPAHQASVRL